MKILITGSRTWTDEGLIRSELEKLPKNTTIIHGKCQTGADAIADKIARELKFVIRSYPANWARWGKSAGPIRNRHMLIEEHLSRERIDLCLAFMHNESSGTRNCMNECLLREIPVRRVP